MPQLKAVAPSDQIAAFAQGAATGDLSVSAAPKLDPNAKPSTGLSLRLNEYQLNMIRTVASREGQSLQKLLKAILLPEIERRFREPA